MPIDPSTRRSDLDVLASTDLASFRGVEFVCGPVSWSFEQQHAVHTYPDRDAGYVESTGRNPATFSFTAIFRRGVVGAGGGRDAFPANFNKFQAACADRTAAPLVHPILGTITVKCQRVNVQVDPARRDGADVEASFIEASEREDELATLLAQTSALGSAYDGARSFDGDYATLQPEPPELPDSLKPSLLDSIKQLSGSIAQYRIGVGNVISQVEGYASAVNDLTDQIIALDNPKNYRAVEALEKTFAAVVRLGQEVQKRTKPVRLAVLPRPMSVVEASSTYATPVAEFCRLNPLAAGRDTLPAGLQVFVYV
jgi:prophage DNA circulation protein